MTDIDSKPHHEHHIGRRRSADPWTRTVAYLREHGQPNVICAIMSLATNPGISELRRTLSERVLSVPRFRSRIVTTGKKAHWEEVKFDVGYHFEVFGFGRKVSEAELTDLESRTTERPLHSDKPLWRVIHVPEMEDGTSRVLFICDHTISDGAGLVTVLLTKLVDPKEAAQTEVKKRPSMSGPKIPLSRRASVGAFGVIQGQTQIFWKADKPNPLKLVGAPTSIKKVAACPEKIDLARIKAVATLQNATINDVLMAVFAKTLSLYLTEVARDDEAMTRKIRATFPINMRRGGLAFNAQGDPENVFTLGLYRVPLAKASDSAALIAETKRQMDEAKISPAYAISYKAPGRLLPIMHKGAFVSLAANGANLGSAMLSNVPGPQKQVYLCGVAVTDFEFFLFRCVL